MDGFFALTLHFRSFHRARWQEPSLTETAEVRLIEVKTSDRLTASQRAILRGLNWVNPSSFDPAFFDDAKEEESEDSDDSACAKAELASDGRSRAIAGKHGLEAAIAKMQCVVAEYAARGVIITGALERCPCSAEEVEVKQREAASSAADL